MTNTADLYGPKAAEIAKQVAVSADLATQSILQNRGSKGSRAALMAALVMLELAKRNDVEEMVALTRALGEEVERGARHAKIVEERKVPEHWRIKCVDHLKNVAYLVRRPDSGSWRCVLGNGTPAAFSFAGIPHNEESAFGFAMQDTKTPEEALRTVRIYARVAGFQYSLVENPQ